MSFKVGDKVTVVPDIENDEFFYWRPERLEHARNRVFTIVGHDIDDSDEYFQLDPPLGRIGSNLNVYGKELRVFREIDNSF